MSPGNQGRSRWGGLGLSVGGRRCGGCRPHLCCPGHGWRGAHRGVVGAGSLMELDPPWSVCPMSSGPLWGRQDGGQREVGWSTPGAIPRMPEA